jgi:transposase-like protein
MIKLVCPECYSDDIMHFEKQSIDDWFVCADCVHEFTFQEASWKSYF